MTPARPVLRAGAVATAALVVLALVAVLVWQTPVLAWWFGLSAVMTAGVTVALARLARPPRGDDGGDGDGDGDDGGSGGDDGPPPPDDDEPEWWPGFERAFRDYVARGREPV